jgi:hypothetical protein
LAAAWLWAISMNKKLVVIVVAACVVVLTIGFGYWRLSQLSGGLQGIQLDSAQVVLVSGMAPLVLAPGVDSGEQSPISREPLLDQYRRDPAFVARRYALVTTWSHATKMVEAADTAVIATDTMLGSASLASRSPENRVDGWNAPYCIWVASKQIVVLSSGGHGQLDCTAPRADAANAAQSSHDPRLTRVGTVLITVQPRHRGTAPVDSR